MNHENVINFCRQYFPNKTSPGQVSQTSSYSGDTKQEFQNNGKKRTLKNGENDLEKIAPLEFMDALTDEIMNDPYELPSGKNIDKTSLDKYIESLNDPKDACDPFTRIPFDSNNYPKLNQNLKQRIKQFRDTNGESELEFERQRRIKLLGS